MQSIEDIKSERGYYRGQYRDRNDQSNRNGQDDDDDDDEGDNDEPVKIDEVIKDMDEFSAEANSRLDDYK